MNLTHIEEGMLIGYCQLSVTAAAAAAIEAHLMVCAQCRAELATTAIATDDRGATQQTMWDGILERVDRPTRSVTERVLGLIGVRDDIAKLLATTPALRLAWLAAVVLVATFAVLAGRIDSDGTWFLLVVAPLLPVAGVATAFGPMLDPTYEIGVAAPMSGLRLTLLRTLAVIATTAPLLTVASFLAPGGRLDALGWVLPSFALVAITLALSTVTPPNRAGVIVGSGWLVAVLVLMDSGRALDFVSNSLIFQSAGQTGAAAIGAIGLAIVAIRRTSFDLILVPGGQR